MKTNAVNTALAAFFAFAGAVGYIILYIAELLPGALFFAFAGILTVIIVLATVTFAISKYCKNTSCFYNALTNYGCALIWGGVICLCLSILLTAISTANATFYTAVLFVVILSWKFTIIMLALFLCSAVPYRCNNTVNTQTTYKQNNCNICY